MKSLLLACICLHYGHVSHQTLSTTSTSTKFAQHVKKVITNKYMQIGTVTAMLCASVYLLNKALNNTDKLAKLSNTKDYLAYKLFNVKDIVICEQTFCRCSYILEAHMYKKKYRSESIQEQMIKIMNSELTALCTSIVSAQPLANTTSVSLEYHNMQNVLSKLSSEFLETRYFKKVTCISQNFYKLKDSNETNFYYVNHMTFLLE